MINCCKQVSSTSQRKPVGDYDRLRKQMAAQGIDIILASSKRNVAYLSDHQTEHWNWEHAVLHMMEKEYDGRDYLVFAGFLKFFQNGL